MRVPQRLQFSLESFSRRSNIPAHSSNLGKRINKRNVDALRASSRARFLWDTDVTGFGCKVTPAGRKVYIFQYRTRDQGSQAVPKRITLGKHGDLTADQAEKLAAANLLVSVKAGTDPALAWSHAERRRGGQASSGE